MQIRWWSVALDSEKADGAGHDNHSRDDSVSRRQITLLSVTSDMIVRAILGRG